MRARNIKPGFFMNEDLADCGPWGRLLFAGLWCLADKAGRLEERPRRIKAEVFPYDEKMPTIESLLKTLAEKGFITRYQVDTKNYIQINNFGEHQHPHHTEKESNLPPPDFHGAITVNSPLDNGYTPSDSLIPDSLIPDSNTLVHSDKPNGRDRDVEFQKFYERYPRKAKKPKALDAWRKLHKLRKLPSLEVILDAIEQQKTWDGWTRDAGRFIPYPASWLNAQSWNDMQPETEEEFDTWKKKFLST
jgi:hypothetical protein